MLRTTVVLLLTLTACAGPRRVTIDTVKDGVSKHGRSVTPCLKAAAADGELTSGVYTFILYWMIQPDGSITNPELHRVEGPAADIDRPELKACFADRMLSWTFAPSDGDPVPIKEFPFGPITIR